MTRDPEPLIAGMAFFAVILGVTGAFVWWSNDAGQKQAYTLPLTILETLTRSTDVTTTTYVTAGTTTIPLSTSTPAVMHHLLTTKGAFINALPGPAPLHIPGCAVIEPRPGQGQYLTAFTPAACPGTPRPLEDHP